MRIISRLLQFVAAFEFGWILAQFYSEGLASIRTEINVFGNPSMAGTYISLALVGTIYEPMAWITAILLGRSTPLLILGVYRVIRHFSAMTCFSVALLFALIVSHYGFPNGTGRFEIWKVYFDWWQSLPAHYHWLGIGWGKTKDVLPALGLMNAIKMGQSQFSSYWVLHNDFLQALIETGYISFGVMALFGSFLFYRADVKQRSIGIAYLVAMAINYPWHAFPHLFLYWIWIISALLPKGDSWNSLTRNLKRLIYWKVEKERNTDLRSPEPTSP